MAGDDVALHAVVHGRVQGVGFRDYVESRARSLRLRGYVRNLKDGRSLEVVAEGARESLQRLVAHLNEGPRMSRVDSVDLAWREATGEFRDFAARL
jgi:acylphosphatase